MRFIELVRYKIIKITFFMKISNLFKEKGISETYSFQFLIELGKENSYTVTNESLIKIRHFRYFDSIETIIKIKKIYSEKIY